ncbi:hypothetical protein CASFOL_000145 [Castilleja foliolosa]|uniref:Uncharacterized protein n=1 Tax=Castilleja foliolosa TaxID=1961234 RepID=A0ABD3ERK6_9LAMI
MEAMFRNFLWQQKDQNRYHWVNWDKICMPLDCGGLGIRSLSDTIFGLHGKLAWNIIQNKSMRSQWMNKKHLRGGQLTCTKLDSKLWRSLFPHIERLQEQAVWILGRGDISFWTANWNGKIIDPYTNPHIKVCDAIHDLDNLSTCLTADQLNKAKKIVLEENQDDTLVYNSSPSGNFSVKSYIHDNMITRSHPYWANLIWNRTIPARLGAFMWKIMNRAIAVDERIGRKGIHGPFKCNCCKTGNLETINHLFFLSDFAKQIWHHFGGIFGITSVAHSLPQLFHIWTKNISLRSQLGYTTLGTMMYSLWGIWKERCRARFEDIDMNIQRVIKFINSNIQDINLITYPKRQIDSWGKNELDRLNIQVKSLVVKRGSWLQWEKPPPGSYKLSTDGAIKNGIATIGGIIRDDMGDMIGAFWQKSEHTSIDATEMDAVIHGVKLCSRLGIGMYRIETDSMAVFKAVDGSSRNPALIYMARKHGLRSRGIDHIHREINGVADLLAKAARSNEDKIFELNNQLPNNVRKTIYFDKIGLKNYRKGKYNSRCVTV